jgi:hypothetical protein
MGWDCQALRRYASGGSAPATLWVGQPTSYPLSGVFLHLSGRGTIRG